MSINLLIANATGNIDSNIDSIKAAFNSAEVYLRQKISLDNVDVICLDSPSMCIKEIGIGGYTPSRNLSYLYVDPNVLIDTSELIYTLCHELSHAKRYDTYGFGSSLYDSIIFEGLATAFEEEVGRDLNMERSHVVSVVSQYKHIDALVAYAKQFHKLETFNYQEWFITGFGEVPRWGGYMIGYKIVSDYLNKHNKKASELLLEDAKIISK